MDPIFRNLLGEEFDTTTGGMMGFKTKVEFDFLHEVDGEEIELLVGAVVEVDFDPNYGADADGNRGVPTYFGEEVEVEYVHRLVSSNGVADRYITVDHQKLFSRKDLQRLHQFAAEVAGDYPEHWTDDDRYDR